MIVVGRHRKRIALDEPTRTPDGDGGYTETWTALNPSEAFAGFEDATVQNMEQHFANTVEAKASHLLHMRYGDGEDVTQKTRITWVDKHGTSHVMFVRGVRNVDQLDIELVLACEEVVSA